MEAWSTAGAAFLLVFVAELGDKTQLLCLTLTSRYRPLQVWVAASAAFLVLNLLAVAVGASLQHWLPRQLLAIIVATLFLFFAWRSWQQADDDHDERPSEPKHSAYLTIFTLIFVGELGDKTQLAVAGLAGTQAALPVWVGASFALSASAGLAAFAGAAMLKKLPAHLIHRSAAILFLLFAIAALAVAFWPAN